jgi:hypothetical protein
MGLAPVITNPARPLPLDTPVNTQRSDYLGKFDMNLEIIGDPGEGRERLCRQLAENDLHDAERRVFYFTTSPVSNGLAALFDVILIGSEGSFPIVEGEGDLLAQAAIEAEGSAIIDLGGIEHHIAARIVERFLARLTRERHTPMTIYFENGDATLRRKRNRDSSSVSAAKTGLSSGFASVGGADMRFVVCAVSSREIPLEIDALLFDVVVTKLSKPGHIQSLAELVSNRALVQYQDIRSLGLRFNHPDEYWIWAFTKNLAHLPKHFRLDDALTPAGRGEPYTRTEERNAVEVSFGDKLNAAREKRDAAKENEQPKARQLSVRTFTGASGNGPRLVTRTRLARFVRINGEQDTNTTLKEKGVKNSELVASIARMTISHARKGKVDYGTPMTHDDVIAAVEAQPSIIDSAAWAVGRRANRTLVSPSIVGYYRNRLGTGDAATAFLTQICSPRLGTEAILRLKLALAALKGRIDEESNLKRFSMIDKAWTEFSKAKAANDDETLGNAA